MNRLHISPLLQLLFLLFALVLAGGFVYLGIENQRLSQYNKTLAGNPPGEQVAVFFIESNETDFKLKPVLASIEAGGDKHLKALQFLLDGPPLRIRGFKLIRLFPKGTRILSYSLKNGLATVNLNNQACRLNVGSSLEALAVASIVNTLTKFPDVYRVKILIEGKEVESLAGHVDLTTELHYSDQVVDPVPIEAR
jgi:spore germination protein GerM